MKITRDYNNAKLRLESEYIIECSKEELYKIYDAMVCYENIFDDSKSGELCMVVDIIHKIIWETRND